MIAVDYQCLDTFDNKKDHKTLDLLISNDKLYVARGEKGITVFSLNPSDKPISNSLSIKRDSTSYYPPATSLAYGHNRLFSVNEKSLAVFEPRGNIVSLTRLKIHTFDKNISSIYVDKELPYVYVGLENKGLVVYSVNDLNVKYDYTNTIKNVSSIFSTHDSLYVLSEENNGTLETYRKTFVGNNLRLNKVHTQYDIENIKIIDIKDNKLSYINKDNNTVGVLNISLVNDNVSTYFSIENNDSSLPRELGRLNDFHYDGIYKVIASSDGLVMVDDENNTFEDLSFHSDRMLIYNDFIISTDDVEENPAKSTKNSSGIRVYKFGDIFVSKNYGRAPLKVKFSIRSLNLYRVSWDFNPPYEIPSYERSPEYEFTKSGDYNILSTITYNSGKVAKEYVPIKIIDDKKIKVSLSANHTAGNAPFHLKVDLKDTDISLIKKISWHILRDGNVSILTNRRVPALDYTFMNSGDYVVKVNVEDFENNMVEKNISIKVKTYFQPEIITDLNRTYMAKDINFSIFYKDRYNDTNGTSERNITSYKWIFHDGSISYQKNATYNYPKTGKHPISVLIKDEYNISYEVNETIDISSSILPLIITQKKVAESPLNATFSLFLENNYKRYISDLTWELPNGFKSKAGAFAYTFNNEGKFKIKNRYKLSDGFIGISEVDIKIDNKVDTNLTSSVDYGFVPLRVDFQMQGTAHSGIKNYNIDYGDGSTNVFTPNQTNFSRTFIEAKMHQIKLTANSNKNHQGITYKKIYGIDVNLSYRFVEKDLDKIAQNKELKVQFEANITNDTFVKSYQWFYGYETDKSAINEKNPNYTYKFNKEYKVQFEITLKNNQTLTKEIIINYPTNEGNIQLYKGWNLISNPLSLPLIKDCSSATSCVKMSKLEDRLVTWILKDNKWEKNPATIPSKYGIWVKTNKNNKLSFYGNRFNLNIANVAINTWHLLGNGEDLGASDLSSFKVLYIYDSKNQKYIKNPTTIKATQGFYAIK